MGQVRMKNYKSHKLLEYQINISRRFRPILIGLKVGNCDLEMIVKIVVINHKSLVGTGDQSLIIDH